MREFLRRLTNSFDNRNEGFSGRKLSAFWGNVLAGILVYFYCNTEMRNFPLVYGITLTYACLCLGLVTASNIINFRHGQKAGTKEADKGAEL